MSNAANIPGAARDVDERSWTYWTTPSTVVVDGLETAFRRSGTGETVVYLHGEGATRAWLPLHQELASGVDLIVPEHPGFGDTERPSDFNRVDDWVLHYESFFRTLGLSRIHLVGHSFGGYLAAQLAVYFPDRFQSVTLINPMGLRLHGEPLRDRFRWTPEEEDSHWFNGRRDLLLEQLTREGSPEQDVQAYAELTSIALLLWNPRYDTKLDYRLARLTAPLLSIGVDDDRVVGNQMATRFAELASNGHFTRITGGHEAPSSHQVVLEQPEDVAAAVIQHVIANS
ncbi:MAG TPA: alpha/beta hydrolase [Pseudolysinimonas sp.]|nr:alpha/beta hydrolase [Pseudolysinimonas sp.]